MRKARKATSKNVLQVAAAGLEKAIYLNFFAEKCEEIIQEGQRLRWKRLCYIRYANQSRFHL